MSIPITILGGFLGAGKTTALNGLLRGARRRIAVLVNDFGAVNIDAALIESSQGGMVSLNNGCVCCSLGPDLGEGVARLVALDPPPEQIVIEASGVSDPWRIAQLARLEDGVVLDAVLVLADASRFLSLLADRWLTDTVTRQVARADMLLLTHGDLAGAAGIAATRAALRNIRPDVPVALMPQDGLPALLLAAHPGAPSRFMAEVPVEHGFRQASWTPRTPLDRARLLAALDALPESVLRVKGFCRLGPEEAMHLVQRAGRRTAIEPWPDEAKADGLAIIGTPEMPDEGALCALLAQAQQDEPNRGAL